MILRNQVEWGLHCCLVLAQLPDGHRASTKDLAEFHGVPKEYLSKALQSLAQAGILEGSLGPKGGYQLARPADQVTFLEIVEAIEGPRRTFTCTAIINNNPCLGKTEKYAGVCDVAQVMYWADEAWRSELSSHNLEQIVQKLRKNLPAERLRENADWFLARA